MPRMEQRRDKSSVRFSKRRTKHHNGGTAWWFPLIARTSLFGGLLRCFVVEEEANGVGDEVELMGTSQVVLRAAQCAAPVCENV
ncbi:hypothetical protein H6P81_011208 [Aristolochia fimbriata]|uniref:Uncharacterized protein n=1 Tax=Aristolochia fimbriata TaxID=158543 RepID=A0AAV7ER71_ARIFI|nr:hypothetical protein H6P81_011208 [Aristolochia fimbriata]